MFSKSDGRFSVVPSRQMTLLPLYVNRLPACQTSALKTESGMYASSTPPKAFMPYFESSKVTGLRFSMDSLMLTGLFPLLLEESSEPLSKLFVKSG